MRIGGEFRARLLQKRTNEIAMLWPHAAKAVQIRSADEVQKHRFRVVVCVMRQRELCIQLFRRFTQKGVAQVARSLFHGLARFARMGAHIAGTRVKGDTLFFAPCADEFFVAHGFFAAQPVVEVRAGNVIALLTQKIEETH